MPPHKAQASAPDAIQPTVTGLQLPVPGDLAVGRRRPVAGDVGCGSVSRYRQLESVHVLSASPPGLGPRLARLRSNRLLRQNIVLFTGGLVAGVGGFVYHAIAGRILGPASYGEVASLIALYAVLTTPALILVIVLARYAAMLVAASKQGAIRHLVLRTSTVILIPCLLAILGGMALSGVLADFLHLHSRLAIVWMGFAVALIWLTAVPRGILQGLQSFTWLSANLSAEMIVRTGILVPLLLAGVVFAYGLGIFSLRDTLHGNADETVQLRAMARFALAAAAGTLGILLLYNLDVILARHYLDDHGAGIYGGLNKIGTILYFLTLSVSQVLFPRVVEALATNNHPGRLLFSSAAIMSVLGAGALLVFAVVPNVVVGLLFGPAFHDAEPYLLLVGMIGLALSLNNLLVQFFMAAHDWWFVPLLAIGVAAMVIAIVVSHNGIGAVVMDVLVTLLVLLGSLTVRVVLLLPQLHSVVEETPAVQTA